VNTVAAKGKRHVQSAFFEIDAPILDSLTVNLSGRYDDYSTGQNNLSPKIGVEFQPIDMLKLRGTYSEGFRIASFNEAYGEPTTGYVSHTVSAATAGGPAFLAAHGNNAYASQSYSYGLTATGNAALNPEESKAYTAGIVLEPIDGLNVTVDYWHIKVDQLISGADYSTVLDEYYANNGVVNQEGITVLPGTPDPAFPNALPVIGFIQYSYQNADSEIASGVDIGVNFTMPFDAFIFSSHLDMSHLMELSKTQGGVKSEYQGTLSPCDVTSCSGAPDWRATWLNSIDWNDFTFALTLNYTGSYSNASVDYGGDPNDCAGSLFASVYAYDDGSPYKCDHDAYMDWDFSATYQINSNFQVYANIVNVFDDEPDHDPTAAYGLYGFNPAWELNGWRGRYFRLGVKYDLD
jgi:iron complex outermembrane receptor protein